MNERRDRDGVIRTLGAPGRWAAIGLIRIYRATLSGWLGGQCRFFPTCSRYAEEAIRARGLIVGGSLACWRVLRCNPFGRGGIEPVPLGRGHRHAGSRAYDAVMQSPKAVDR